MYAQGATIQRTRVPSSQDALKKKNAPAILSCFSKACTFGLALYGQGPALSVASGVLWGVHNTPSADKGGTAVCLKFSYKTLTSLVCLAEAAAGTETADFIDLLVYQGKFQAVSGHTTILKYSAQGLTEPKHQKRWPSSSRWRALQQQLVL